MLMQKDNGSKISHISMSCYWIIIDANFTNANEAAVEM